MAIAAVFLALALGILIGVSFGDSFLVANQRDVIQLMEEQLERLRESNRRREIELQRWESLEPPIRQHFNGALVEKEVFIISLPDQESTGLKSLLEEAGAAVTVIQVPEASEELAGAERSFGAAGDLACLLAGPGEIEIEELTAKGLLLSETDAAMVRRPPDCCLLLLEAVDYISGEFFKELRLKLHENEIRVIVLFPWREEESPRNREEIETDLSLVDNIDTFWGQIALLKMIAGNIDGYYGFGKGSGGLIPAQARED